MEIHSKRGDYVILSCKITIEFLLFVR